MGWRWDSSGDRAEGLGNSCLRCKCSKTTWMWHPGTWSVVALAVLEEWLDWMDSEGFSILMIPRFSRRMGTQSGTPVTPPVTDTGLEL